MGSFPTAPAFSTAPRRLERERQRAWEENRANSGQKPFNVPDRVRLQSVVINPVRELPARARGQNPANRRNFQFRQDQRPRRAVHHCPTGCSSPLLT